MRFASLTALIALGIACDPPGNNVPEFSFSGRPATGCANVTDDNCADGDPWFQNATRDSISKLYAWPANPTTTPGAGSEGVCDETLEAFNPGDEVTWPSLAFNVQISDVDRDDLTLELWIRAASGDDRSDNETMLCQTTVYGRGQDRTESFGNLATNDCALYLAVNASRSVRDDIEDALGTDLRINSDPRTAEGADPVDFEAANAVEVFVATHNDSGILEFADLPMPCTPGAEDDYCITAHDVFGTQLTNTSPSRVYELELRVSDGNWDSLSDPEIQAQLNKHVLFQIYTFDPRFSWQKSFVDAAPDVPQDSDVQVAFTEQGIAPSLTDQYFNYVACRKSGGVGASSVASASVNPRELDGWPTDPRITPFEAVNTKRDDTIILKSATCWAPELRKANNEPEPTTNYCTPISVTTATIGPFSDSPVLTHPSDDPWALDPRGSAIPTLKGAEGLNGAQLWAQWLVNDELVGAPSSTPADGTDPITAPQDYSFDLPLEAGPIDALGLTYGYCPPGLQPSALDQGTGWLTSASGTQPDATLEHLCTPVQAVDLLGMIPLVWAGGLAKLAPFTTPNNAPRAFSDLVAQGNGNWVLAGPQGAEWFNANQHPHDLFFTEPRGIASILGTTGAVVVHGDIAYLLNGSYDHSQALDTTSCTADPNCEWLDFQGSGEVVALNVAGEDWVVGSDSDTGGRLVAATPGGGNPIDLGIPLGDAYALHAVKTGLVFVVTTKDTGSSQKVQVRVATNTSGSWSSKELLTTPFTNTLSSTTLSLDYDPGANDLLVGAGAGDGKVWWLDLKTDVLSGVNTTLSVDGVDGEGFGAGVAFVQPESGVPEHFYALAPSRSTSVPELGSPVDPVSKGVLYKLPLPADSTASSIDAEEFFTFPPDSAPRFLTTRADAREEVYLGISSQGTYAADELYALP